MTELLTRTDTSGLDRIGLALSDPIRRGILIELLSGRACPSDLADRLETSRSNLSNHLACLRGCRLIRAERAGRYLYYELANEELAGALQSLVSLVGNLPECEDHRP